MKYLLVYWFKSITPKERTKFNRKLYGYSDSSNFGNYVYKRDGVLKNYKKITKGVVLMDQKPKNLHKTLKSANAEYKIFNVSD